MLMPLRNASILQSRLLAYDDVGGTCAYMIKYTTDDKGLYLHHEWQDAVDNIYRCVKSDLLLINNDNFFIKYDSLFEALRRNSPFDSKGDQILWNGTLLDRTDKLTRLVDKYIAVGIRWDVVDTNFIEDLEDIFAEAGVPWSTEPLVPIIVADR